jgi:hypothetical protein
MELHIGGIYHHYKNKDKHYKIIGIGKSTETEEEMVIYEPLYETETKYWLRPLTMFMSTVEVDGATIPRFSEVK